MYCLIIVLSEKPFLTVMPNPPGYVSLFSLTVLQSMPQRDQRSQVSCIAFEPFYPMKFLHTLQLFNDIMLCRRLNMQIPSSLSLRNIAFIYFNYFPTHFLTNCLFKTQHFMDATIFFLNEETVTCLMDAVTGQKQL